jgi:hypothetical protein
MLDAFRYQPDAFFKINKLVSEGRSQAHKQNLFAGLGLTMMVNSFLESMEWQS